MAKLGLLGNLTFDQVFLVNNFKEGSSNTADDIYFEIGGIGNVLRILPKDINIKVSTALSDDAYGLFARASLEKHNIELSSFDVHTPTTTATIIANKNKSVRTSIVRWGACSDVLHEEPLDVDWCHILYGDRINYTHDFIVRQSERSIVSMDLCERHVDAETTSRLDATYPYIDYLIISDNELYGIHYSLYDLGSLLKGWVIVHSDSKSIASDGEDKITTDAPSYLENINVLGAGDMFAGHFIVSQLGGKSLEDSIYNAHQNTTDYLSVQQQSSDYCPGTFK